MEHYRLLILSGLIVLSLTACKVFQTEEEFNSLEQTTTAASPSSVPIRLKSNKRYIKHRLPQRRYAHKAHRRRDA